MIDEMQKNLLKEIAGFENIPEGAFSLRSNGESVEINSTADIQIKKKTDKPGIDIYISPNTKNQRVDIPVIVSKAGITDIAYNDFFVGENADVLIVAGCGIHNAGNEKSEHDGIHSFHIGKNSKVKYIEKHYGEGDGNGEKILNPTTIIEIDEGGYLEMDSAQIKGVDSTDRKTSATLKDRAVLIVNEKIFTHGKQVAKTEFTINLNGKDCGTHVTSRSVARDESKQVFLSYMNGNEKCSGHTECDAILMDNAIVEAIPKITANNIDAKLIHEAAIGKIAGEQLDKLMTLGLSEKEAEEKIISGFLK